ncbi:hypothetical protein I546_5048 [Mycobacterium kansasii 732]|nr:hypothetical protein I546_5048 [Mycobacterium kansasii 732]
MPDLEFVDAAPAAGQEERRLPVGTVPGQGIVEFGAPMPPPPWVEASLPTRPESGQHRC